MYPHYLQRRVGVHRLPAREPVGVAVPHESSYGDPDAHGHQSKSHTNSVTAHDATSYNHSASDHGLTVAERLPGGRQERARRG
jgi:hypothetical protein